MYIKRVWRSSRSHAKGIEPLHKEYHHKLLMLYSPGSSLEGKVLVNLALEAFIIREHDCRGPLQIPVSYSNGTVLHAHKYVRDITDCHTPCKYIAFKEIQRAVTATSRTVASSCPYGVDSPKPR